MRKEPREIPVVVRGEATSAHDEAALRKVARAVLAIAKRQLAIAESETTEPTPGKNKEPGDAS